MNHKQNEKSLVFIGFMGVGKTTVAKLIAKKLNRPFIDIDVEIEKEFQMPITEIFKQYGEKTFREKEKETVLHHCKQREKVISLGGGAFMQNEIRDTCLASSIVIFLDISWEKWKDRIPILIDSRPILQTRSIEEIEALFNERKNIYEQCHLRVNTDEKRPEEIANEIIQAVQRIN